MEGGIPRRKRERAKARRSGRPRYKVVELDAKATHRIPPGAVRFRVWSAGGGAKVRVEFRGDDP